MRFINNQMIVLAALIGSSSLSRVSHAEAHNPYEASLNARSRASGLGAATVSLLARGEGRGADVVTEHLMKAFEVSTHPVTTRNVRDVQKKGDQNWVAGDDWYLEVKGRGNWIRYRRNAAVLNGPGVPLDNAPNPEKLEGLALDFIAHELAAFVPLASNERIVRSKVVRQFEGVQSRTDRQVSEVVAATYVVFTRVINGIDVVGPGSKLMVMFTNKAEIVGFDVDWSEFQNIGISDKTLSIGQINDRKAMFSPHTNNPNARSFRFECGYYDMGANRASSDALLQPACINHVKVTSARHTPNGILEQNEGYIEVIPAGEQPEPDKNWHELAAFGIQDRASVPGYHP